MIKFYITKFDDEAVRVDEIVLMHGEETGESLATFDTEKGRIDMSVLKPYIGEDALLIYKNESGDIVEQAEKRIDNVKLLEKETYAGYIVNFEKRTISNYVTRTYHIQAAQFKAEKYDEINEWTGDKLKPIKGYRHIDSTGPSYTLEITTDENQTTRVVVNEGNYIIKYQDGNFDMLSEKEFEKRYKLA